MKLDKINYFSDELRDEFSGISRETITIDKNYKYIHKNVFWRIGAYITYRIIMTPIAYVYLKEKFHCRFVNRKLLKQSGRTGCFLYGNHTQVPGDGYIPVIASFPMRDRVIVNADNVSLKGTKTFMEMIGAYPIANSLSGMRNFLHGLEHHCKNGDCIVVYPEAHIWPYYTKIRPFGEHSFAYPVKFDKPTYCMTTTYTKRKKSHKPDIIVYIDGPFFADKGLTEKQASKQLRDKVYATMCQRSKNSNYEYVRYVRKEKADD